MSPSMPTEAEEDAREETSVKIVKADTMVGDEEIECADFGAEE